MTEVIEMADTIPNSARELEAFMKKLYEEAAKQPVEPAEKKMGTNVPKKSQPTENIEDSKPEIEEGAEKKDATNVANLKKSTVKSEPSKPEIEEAVSPVPPAKKPRKTFIEYKPATTPQNRVGLSRKSVARFNNLLISKSNTNKRR